MMTIIAIAAGGSGALVLLAIIGIILVLRRKPKKVQDGSEASSAAASATADCPPKKSPKKAVGKKGSGKVAPESPPEGSGTSPAGSAPPSPLVRHPNLVTDSATSISSKGALLQQAAANGESRQLAAVSVLMAPGSPEEDVPSPQPTMKAETDCDLDGPSKPPSPREARLSGDGGAGPALAEPPEGPKVSQESTAGKMSQDDAADGTDAGVPRPSPSMMGATKLPPIDHRKAGASNASRRLLPPIPAGTPPPSAEIRQALGNSLESPSEEESDQAPEIMSGNQS